MFNYLNTMENHLLNISVEDDYVPSDGEINNIVYLVCKYTVGWPMRPAGLMVCTTMAGLEGGKITGNAGISCLVRVTCEYLWDHVCGEPETPTTEELFDHIRPALETWYANSTPEERADTKEEKSSGPDVH